MTRLVPLLVLIVIVLAAVGCASSATSDPAPTATTVLPPELTLAPTATDPPMGRPSTDDGEGAQLAQDFCAPTAAVGVSVGESWTIAGSIKITAVLFAVSTISLAD